MKIFLSAPFSKWISPETGLVLPERRFQLEGLRGLLLREGHCVFSPHHNEDWGLSWLEAERCTERDYWAIRQSDAVLAVLATPESSGIAVELGWASALRVGVILFVEPQAPETPLISGLGSVALVERINLRSNHWDASGGMLDLDRALRAVTLLPLSVPCNTKLGFVCGGRCGDL